VPHASMADNCEMNTPRLVDYARFRALSGLELCHYMEPLLVDPATQVSIDVLDRMLSELPTYDEYHLVYALTLGAKLSPDTFASHLPRFLAHEQGSVWSTALNCLNQLSDKYVTQELVNSVRRVYSTSPGKAWIPEVLGKLEKRLST
jgi:hypothetical protein